MGLSKLSEKCRKCPHVMTCDHKRMEAIGFLPYPCAAETVQLAATGAEAPILRETTEIRVDGRPMTVYKDQIERELYKHLYSGLGLHYAT